jgi:hypothetical protein
VNAWPFISSVSGQARLRLRLRLRLRARITEINPVTKGWRLKNTALLVVQIKRLPHPGAYLNCEFREIVLLPLVL